MLNLEQSFKQRARWYNNRASTYFPVFINKYIDTFLIFQNYWEWKNGLDDCLLNIRVYSQDGDLYMIYSSNIEEEHNEISIKNILLNSGCIGSIQSDKLNKFTIEVEIISTKNLSYPFPAVMIFTQNSATTQVSSVHSGGRSLNPNEPQSYKQHIETNWLAKQDNMFTSFFHVFNNGLPFNSDSGLVDICIEGSTDILSIPFELPLKPFSSNIYYLEDLADSNILKLIDYNKFFLRVRFVSLGFMRLIVGNYHKESQFHYLTHSFSEISSSSKDITSSSADQISSLLSVINQPPLSVVARSYPTNIRSKVKMKRYDHNIGEKEIFKGETYIETSSKYQNVNQFELIKSNFASYKLFGDAPSRINVSYNYFLKNSLHPTDIATGFDSKHFPKRYRHWGHGCSKRGFKTIILATLRSYQTVNVGDSENNFTVEFISKNTKFERHISLVLNGWNYIILDFNDFDSESDFFSWRVIDDIGDLLFYWVSFNESTGSICGEHSF